MAEEGEGPLVSVLIGVYNAAPYIGEAIESALTQDHRPLEVVVVDDGSDDGSDDVVRSYEPDVRFVRQERGGIGNARNHAVTLATGEYLAFLDADDRFMPGKLRRQLAAFDEDPTLDMVFGHMREFISPGVDPATIAPPRTPPEGLPWYSPSLMLVKHESFLKVGGYSTTLRVGVGVDWYARATDLGLRARMLPEVLLERRLHHGNNGRREADARTQYLHVLKASIDRKRAGSGGTSATGAPGR